MRPPVVQACQDKLLGRLNEHVELVLGLQSALIAIPRRGWLYGTPTRALRLDFSRCHYQHVTTGLSVEHLCHGLHEGSRVRRPLDSGSCVRASLSPASFRLIFAYALYTPNR